jgi:hypothetical protein
MTIYTVDPGATSSGLTLNPGDEVFVAGVISATTNNSGLDLITSGGQAFDNDGQQWRRRDRHSLGFGDQYGGQQRR